MARLQASLSQSELATYVTNQLNQFFNDGKPVSEGAIQMLLPETMARVEHCFAHINNRYFFDGKTPLFDHLHGDHYAMLLYLLSSTAYRCGVGDGVPSKLFLLNKCLHGIDVYYEVRLPAIFLFVHPLGTVLGRGSYSDFLVVYQRCGVGSNHDVYPQLGEYVTLRPGSAVLGKSRIGRGCTVATESLVLDNDVPDGSVYIGNPRDFVIRPAKETTLPIWQRRDRK